MGPDAGGTKKPGTPDAVRLDGRATSGGAAGLFWGAVGVLAFSVSLPATRLAVAGGLDAGFVGLGRAVVSGLLALATLAFMRQPWPAARLLPRFAVVGGCVVLGFPLLTALALARVPAAHGIVVTGLVPAATAVAAVLRAGERPPRRFWPCRNLRAKSADLESM